MNKIKQHLIVLAGIISAGISFAADPVFTIDFNESKIRGVKADGYKVLARYDEKPKIVNGISGKGVLLDRTSLYYTSNGIVNPSLGAVSFWIKPVDWGDKNINCLPIFTLDTSGGYGWRILLYYHADASGKLLDFRMKMPQNREVMAWANTKSGNFKKGEWNHIVLSWTNMEMNIYVNGTYKVTSTYGLPIDRPEKDNEKIYFMPNNFWKLQNKFKTELDEIKFFASDLTPAEVQQLYLEGKPVKITESERASAGIPKTARKPEIDGKIGPDEWNDAASLPLQTHLASQRLYDSAAAWVLAKHDDKFLYLAYLVEKQVPVNCTAAAGKRCMDALITNGDEVEFIVNKGKHAASNESIQYFLAPNGSFAYKIPGSWKAESGWLHAASSGKNGWIGEMAIPLSELPFKNGALTANFGLHRPKDPDIDSKDNRWLAWSSCGKAGYFTESSGTLFLNGKAQGALDFGNLMEKQLQYKSVGNTVLKLQSMVNKKSLEIKKNGEIQIPWSGLTKLTLKGDQYNWVSLADIREYAEMNSECFSDRKEINFDIRLSRSDKRVLKAVKQGDLIATAEILDLKGKRYGLKKKNLKSFRETVVVPFSPMPTGKYILKTTLSNSVLNVVLQKDFIVPDLSFLGNQLGMEKVVPAPWTKPILKGDTVTMKYQKYRFGKDPFPVQMENRGYSVLRSTSGLQLVRNGKTVKWKDFSEKSDTGSNEYIHASGSMKAADDSLQLNWKRTLEYDGLLRYDFSLIPLRNDVSLDRLSVDFVLPPEHSNAFGDPAFAILPANQKSFSGKHTLSVWGKRGICIFTGDDTNYVFGKSGMPFTVVRQPDGSARVTATLIGKSISLPERAELSLGLMTIPGKAPRPDWRKIHSEGWWGYPGQNLAIRGWSHEAKLIGFKRTYLLPEPWDPESIRREIQKDAKRGIACIPYCCNTNIPSNNSLQYYFGPSWACRTKDGVINAGIPAKDFDGQDYHFLYPVLVNHPEFRDYLAYYTAKIMDDYGYAGLYQDGGGVGISPIPYNFKTVKNVLSKDRPVLRTNIWGLRKCYKRLWKIIHSRKKDGYLWAHSWRTFHPAAISFVDLVNPGEEFMHSFPLNHHVYVNDPKLSTPDLWRYAYSSDANGVGMQFLPLVYWRPEIKSFFRKGLKNTIPERRKLCESMIMMCMLNDIPMSGSGYPGIEGLWPVLDREKIADADFVHYDDQKDITTDDPNVKVSYYDWPKESRRMIVIGNFGKAAASVKVQLPSGFSPQAVEPWPDEKKIDFREKIELPGYASRIFIIRK